MTRHNIALILALLPPLAVRLYMDVLDDPATALERVGLLALVAASAYGWSVVFARRFTTPQTDQLHFAMLFCVLVPEPVSWGGAVLAASFGWVFGREIFGPRALLPPAIVAVAFGIFSFPNDDYTALNMLYAYPEPLLALACLPGAAWLLWTRDLSPTVVAGTIAGAALTAWALGAPFIANHFILGTFAVGVLFIAAAPDCAPRSLSAKVVFGLLLGALIITVRLKNPDQPDGVAFAILLVALFAPLLDRAFAWGKPDA